MRILLTFICILFLFSCKQESNLNKITDAADYNKYLSAEPVATTSKYFELWNSKIKPDSIQLLSFGIVASQYENYFKSTGDIEFLKKSEQALEKAVEIAAISRASYRRALARNYISQHRFKEALVLADSARILGQGAEATQGLLFDIHMELGNYDIAERYLDSIKNMADFGYLLRLSKWSDYKGDLAAAIRFMEKAKKKTESSKNKDLMLWSYTNLADYYGHAGRIKDSYEHFLKSLEIDPQNSYAKKGIAWIVFSYEKNPEEALRILDSVTKTNIAPDYYLFKSEIADYMGNEKARISNLEKYFSTVDDPAYGDMYNAYSAVVYLDETEQFNKALSFAQKEVENRATPHSYDLLAYSYFKMGDTDKALQIVEEHIQGKTFEPAILYHAAEIYKAAGKTKQVAELKSELSGAVYELGPSMEDKIARL